VPKKLPLLPGCAPNHHHRLNENLGLLVLIFKSKMISRASNSLWLNSVDVRGKAWAEALIDMGVTSMDCMLLITLHKSVPYSFQKWVVQRVKLCSLSCSV